MSVRRFVAGGLVALLTIGISACGADVGRRGPSSAELRPGASSTLPASGSAPVPGPSGGGRALACPFAGAPDGPRSTQEAADCVMVHWAAGDGAGARPFAVDDRSVAVLFGVEAQGTPSSLGCVEAARPLPAPDFSPADTPKSCSYALVGGGVAQLYVDSDDGGAFVFFSEVA